jgi:hypothetical protein
MGSVVGGAGLLHPPDGVGRGQDRDAVAMGDRGRCPPPTARLTMLENADRTLPRKC